MLNFYDKQIFEKIKGIFIGVKLWKQIRITLKVSLILCLKKTMLQE